MNINKEDIEKVAKKAGEFTAKQSWPVWVKHLIVAAIGAAAAVAAMLF